MAGKNKGKKSGFAAFLNIVWKTIVTLLAIAYWPVTLIVLLIVGIVKLVRKVGKPKQRSTKSANGAARARALAEDSGGQRKTEPPKPVVPVKPALTPKPATASKTLTQKQLAENNTLSAKAAGLDAYTRAIAEHLSAVAAIDESNPSEVSLLMAESDVLVIQGMRERLAPQFKSELPVLHTTVYNKLVAYYESAGRYQDAIDVCQRSIVAGMDEKEMQRKMDALKEMSVNG